MAFNFPEDKADFTCTQRRYLQLGRHQVGHENIQG